MIRATAEIKNRMLCGSKMEEIMLPEGDKQGTSKEMSLNESWKADKNRAGNYGLEIGWEKSLTAFPHGFPGGARCKEPDCQCRRHKRHGFDLWVGKISWRRSWQPTPVFLPSNPKEKGAWRAAVHVVTKSWMWLKQLSTHASPHRGCTGKCSRRLGQAVGLRIVVSCSCKSTPEW